MNQPLPLGNGDCAFNSPRQMCSALSLPSVDSGEGRQLPGLRSNAPSRLATSSLGLSIFWVPQPPGGGCSPEPENCVDRVLSKAPPSSGMLWSGPAIPSPPLLTPTDSRTGHNALWSLGCFNFIHLFLQ